MSTLLYALKPAVLSIQSTGLPDNRVLYSIQIDEDTLIFITSRSGSELLFDLLADTSREVARAYNSIVDGKPYTEWLTDHSPLEAIITEDGRLFPLDQLPPEESL